MSDSTPQHLQDMLLGLASTPYEMKERDEVEFWYMTSGRSAGAEAALFARRFLARKYGVQLLGSLVVGAALAAVLFWQLSSWTISLLAVVVPLLLLHHDILRALSLDKEQHMWHMWNEYRYSVAEQRVLEEYPELEMALEADAAAAMHRARHDIATLKTMTLDEQKEWLRSRFIEDRTESIAEKELHDYTVRWLASEYLHKRWQLSERILLDGDTS